MFVKKDNHIIDERVASAVLDTLTSDKDGRDDGLYELLRLMKNDSEKQSYFTSALPLSREIAKAASPLVWRSLLDEIKDGNMTAIRLYFDIFGRDIGKTDNDDLKSNAEIEIDNLREELFAEDET